MGRMYLARDMTPDSLDDVRRLAENARGFIDHIYLHWTAGWYGQCYDDYHICIDEHGEITGKNTPPLVVLAQVFQIHL